MKNNTIKVKIADLAAKKGDGLIITVGLGSCVGIALYDSANKVGGLAHILLADSKQFQNRSETFNKAKFADTAIPLLIGRMENLGAERKKLRAKIAGGSKLFDFQNKSISIGEKNIAAVISTLKEMEIPILGQDVGGNYGRTMRLLIDTGRVLISTVGKGDKEL